ncbi:hypothetical protein CsSME_00027722 [Camellia sinensis var. sinensis]
MKELGDLSYFLVISITTTASGYVLSQTKYAQPCSSPISVKPTLPPNADHSFPDPALYRSLVGALQYLTSTRPDISLARLLRFVKGTRTHGQLYSPSSFDVYAFTDSNWAAKLMLCPSPLIRLPGDVEDTNSADTNSATPPTQLNSEPEPTQCMVDALSYGYTRTVGPIDGFCS